MGNLEYVAIILIELRNQRFRLIPGAICVSFILGAFNLLANLWNYSFVIGKSEPESIPARVVI